MRRRRERHRWTALWQFCAPRRVVPVLMLVTATVPGAWGNTDLGQSRAAVPSSVPSLARCVTAWNAAVLGTGRKTIRVVARTTHTALMASSRDGVCVLAFSPDAGYRNGRGVYFSLLRGAYDPRTTPVNGLGSPHPPLGGEAMMREPAATQTNVEVQAQTGLINATPGGVIQTRAYTLLDSGRFCKTVIDPNLRNPNVPYGYKVIRSTASCGWVRSLIFAYEAREGSLLGRGRSGAPIRELAGWRCSGVGPFPARSVTQALHFRLQCVRGVQIVEARGASGHVLGAQPYVAGQGG